MPSIVLCWTITMIFVAGLCTSSNWIFSILTESRWVFRSYSENNQIFWDNWCVHGAPMTFASFLGCFLSHLEFLFLHPVVSYGLLRNLRIVTDLHIARDRKCRIQKKANILVLISVPYVHMYSGELCKE